MKSLFWNRANGKTARVRSPYSRGQSPPCFSVPEGNRGKVIVWKLNLLREQAASCTSFFVCLFSFLLIGRNVKKGLGQTSGWQTSRYLRRRRWDMRGKYMHASYMGLDPMNCCCCCCYCFCHSYRLFKPKRWQKPVRNIKQARAHRPFYDSVRAVTIVFTDKHTGQGRCRWVPPGELPINTPAFSLTWRLVPDRKTETKKECKSKHEGRNSFFSEGDMKICLLEGTGAAKRMWSFHCWEKLFGGWLTHLFFIFHTSFFFKFLIECPELLWLPWTRMLFCRYRKTFQNL